MYTREELIYKIKDRLAIYAVRVDMDKGEASRQAESFYCELLNILLGYHLKNMNLVRPNFPAIDLGDDSDGVKLGVQVTSTTTRQKVQDTLDTFFGHKLENTYTHLVMLVIGKWTESRKKFRMNGTVRFDPNVDIWDTDWLLKQIDGIQDNGHLRRILDHLEENLHLASEAKGRPLLVLPLRTAMDADSFVGRERELEEIEARFAREKIVILSGLGGMGKTELAVRYGEAYRKSRYGMVFFSTFSIDFSHTIADEIARGIPSLVEKKLSDEQRFKETISVLNRCEGKDLLIIDNADTKEESFEDLRWKLSALPMRILITTRCTPIGAISVDRLRREELHKIFQRYNACGTEQMLDNLIEAVDGHTLIIDLMARSMQKDSQNTTAEKFLVAQKSEI